MGAPEHRLLRLVPSTPPACGRLRTRAPAPLAERRRFAGPLAVVLHLLPQFRLLDPSAHQPAVLRERHRLLRLPACVVGRLAPGHVLVAHEAAIAEALATLHRRRGEFPAQPWATARTARFGLDLELELWSAPPRESRRARLLHLTHRVDAPAPEGLRLSA